MQSLPLARDRHQLTPVYDIKYLQYRMPGMSCSGIELSHATPVTCGRPEPPRLVLGRASSREVKIQSSVPGLKHTGLHSHGCGTHRSLPNLQPPSREVQSGCLLPSWQSLQPPARSALPGALGKVRVSFIPIISCD